MEYTTVAEGLPKHFKLRPAGAAPERSGGGQPAAGPKPPPGGARSGGNTLLGSEATVHDVAKVGV